MQCSVHIPPLYTEARHVVCHRVLILKDGKCKSDQKKDNTEKQGLPKKIWKENSANVAVRQKHRLFYLFMHTEFPQMSVFFSPQRGVYSFRAQNSAECLSPVDPGVSRGRKCKSDGNFFWSFGETRSPQINMERDSANVAVRQRNIFLVYAYWVPQMSVFFSSTRVIQFSRSEQRWMSQSCWPWH